MGKWSDGLLSERLYDLYIFAKETKLEMELISNDTVLQRQINALKEYQNLINGYQSMYLELVEGGLLEYADTRKLMDFIIEQSISNPRILQDLVQFLGLAQRWRNISGREGKTN